MNLAAKYKDRFTHLYTAFYDLLQIEEPGNKQDEKKVHLIIYNVQNLLKSIKVELDHFYVNNEAEREAVYNDLIAWHKHCKTLIATSQISLKEKRLAYFDLLESNIKQAFKKDNLQIEQNIKLKFNSSNYVLYGLIQQLKIAHVTSKPFLPQTNKELAQFIKNNVEGFEDTDVSTIENELGRKQSFKGTTLTVKTKEF